MPQSVLQRIMGRLRIIPVSLLSMAGTSDTEKLKRDLLEIGIPAALITVVVGLVIVAILDPEPFSKLVAALAAALGIGTIAATPMALLILRKFRSDGGKGA
jgi:hypothetical protein